jgi:DNA primase
VAARFYHEQLCQSGAARDYLARRGIMLCTAIQQRIGYAPGFGLVHHLRGHGLDLGIAEMIALLRGGRETLAGRIVIPYLEHGRATWLTGRAVGEARRRYLSLRLPVPLLGRTLITGDEVVLTEGPFDWLTARQWGLPALALLGSHVSRRAVRSLQQYRRVYLVLDTDPAGQCATRQFQDELGAAAVPVPLPPGVSDLNELACRRGGREALLGSLHAAGYGQIYTSTEWGDFTAERRPALTGRPA